MPSRSMRSPVKTKKATNKNGLTLVKLHERLDALEKSLINSKAIDMTEQNVRVQHVFLAREFDAPAAKVWKAWTEPAQILRWWGPKDCATGMCRIDFRVGGKYLNSMRSEDGLEFTSTGEFKEIEENKRIVATESFADADGNVVEPKHYGFGEDIPIVTLVTVTFEENEGKTTMTLHHDGHPEGSRDMVIAGWSESFDKLAENLRSI